MDEPTSRETEAESAPRSGARSTVHRATLDGRGLPPSGDYSRGYSSRGYGRSSTMFDGRLLAGALALLALVGLIWAFAGGGGDPQPSEDIRPVAPEVVEDEPAVLSAPPAETVERTIRRTDRVRRLARSERRSEDRKKPSRRKARRRPAAPPAPPPAPAPVPSVPAAPPPVPSGTPPEFL